MLLAITSIYWPLFFFVLNLIQILFFKGKQRFIKSSSQFNKGKEMNKAILTIIFLIITILSSSSVFSEQWTRESFSETIDSAVPENISVWRILPEEERNKIIQKLIWDKKSEHVFIGHHTIKNISNAKRVNQIKCVWFLRVNSNLCGIAESNR